MPVYMVAPQQSVVVNLDAGVSYGRNIGYETIVEYNKKYLDGYVISKDNIPFDNIKCPTHVFNKFTFLKYT